jgi:hypothetical protein
LALLVGGTHCHRRGIGAVDIDMPVTDGMADLVRHRSFKVRL